MPIGDGLNLLTWAQDSFGFADGFDEAAGRYQGLRGGQMVTLVDAHAPGLVVKPDVASQADGCRAGSRDTALSRRAPAGAGSGTGTAAAGG